MAKKWTPSQKQLSMYDTLLARQNEVRKNILRRRRVIEEEGTGRTLPDLIIPKKARRYRDLSRYKFDSYAELRKQLKALRDLYGIGDKNDPTRHFYKATYRNNIISHIKDWIGSKLGFNEKPALRNGRYSEEQIYRANQVSIDGGRFLELYNKLLSLNTELFMSMYDSGMIPPLKYIYQEMQGEVEFSMVDEFLETYSEKRKQALEQKNIMTKSISSRKSGLLNNEDFIIKNYNKHTRKYKIEED